MSNKTLPYHVTESTENNLCSRAFNIVMLSYVTVSDTVSILLLKIIPCILLARRRVDIVISPGFLYPYVIFHNHGIILI